MAGPQDTATHPTPIPTNPSQHAAFLTLDQVAKMIDERIGAYHDQRMANEANIQKQDLRKKVLTGAVVAVGGLALGVGVTLGVQRLRSGKAKPGLPAPMPGK